MNERAGKGEGKRELGEKGRPVQRLWRRGRKGEKASADGRMRRRRGWRRIRGRWVKARSPIAQETRGGRRARNTLAGREGRGSRGRAIAHGSGGEVGERLHVRLFGEDAGVRRRGLEAEGAFGEKERPKGGEAAPGPRCGSTRHQNQAGARTRVRRILGTCTSVVVGGGGTETPASSLIAA